MWHFQIAPLVCLREKCEYRILEKIPKQESAETQSPNFLVFQRGRQIVFTIASDYFSIDEDKLQVVLLSAEHI